ncbi:hypothetical protein [Nocardioides sp.]|uniref:hypothetical protein n=1 Tax=Nocardioides sp. TaxID=35761 RepID=UPI002722092E|nr:hypothetical protein [Nocardioides sp.]MDO9458027.1 hypothetical protein [Nocardioides sp.]
MSTAVGASMLAHGLHYAMVLAGLWGLAALLLPHALTRWSHAHPPAYDEHERRVAALRAAVTSGAPGVAFPDDPPMVGTASTRAAPVPVLSAPLAVVATAAAAGIHAAVAPPHLREQTVAGLFFLVTAAAQLAWAAAAAGRPTPTLLRAGVVLNLGLVALWLLTRTAGLPFGLLPEPHPVGPWDLTCVAWQVAAAAACAGALRDGSVGTDDVRCPSWFDWHPSTRAAVGAAAVSLVLLTLSGAHS